MRRLAVLLLAAGSIFAADFTTGQAARAVIGQPTFTAQLPTSSDVILGGVSGLAYVNGILIVADSNRVGASPENHRVLIFDNIQDKIPAPTAEIGQGERCPLCTGKADVVLGQPDFTKSDPGLSQTGLRLPTYVASDGTHLVVADTDNNRVLIWNTIPRTNNLPADVVVGQPDFTSSLPNSGTGDSRVPSAKSLRGPQGVWIQNGKLFVADDQNHRVLIWNSVPTQNFQPADIVLGQPNFNTAIEPDLTKKTVDAKANTLLNPVAVSSDGVRVFVTDLGHNRVLIWNTIPTQNQAPADVVIGQPDMTTAIANYTGKGGVCPVFAQDDKGNDIYPQRCGATLDFPRFALSDGTRLFIADGGNDRILIFNHIPTQNGETADVVLGQINDRFVQTSDTEDNPDVARRSAADALRTPLALAWDGTNLYVSDPYSRRVLVFTVGATALPLTAVRNAASQDIFAVGTVTLGGQLKENDELTLKIRDKEYKYKVKKDDKFSNIIDALVGLINAGDGDPWVLASPDYPLDMVILTSRIGGPTGNDTEISASASSGATTTVSTSGAKLSGGQDAAKIAPGTLVTVHGENLADAEVSAPESADPLPQELGGVQVYVDGIRAPLLSVSPKQVNFQVPFEVLDSTSVSAYVRTRHADGSLTITTAVGVPIIPANPGIFALPGTDPRPGVVLHGSSQASGTVLIDGTAKAGDKVTVTIEDRSYTYTVKEGDTLASVRDALIPLINEDPKVYAFPAGQFERIRVRARVEGPEGNGIRFSASGEGGNVIMGTTNSTLCCANVAGAPVTEDNPAVPGETIIVYATGLGLVEPDEAKFAMFTGFKYKGPFLNKPDVFVSSLAGGKTANVLHAGMKPGTVGTFEVDLELNPDIPTNPQTQLTIAQDIYVSNIITFAVVNPNPAP